MHLKEYVYLPDNKSCDTMKGTIVGKTN